MIFDPYLMPRPLSVLKYNESAIIIFSKSTYETFALVSQLKICSGGLLRYGGAN